MSNDKSVYFIRPIGRDGPIKIGCSKTPADRLEALIIWSPDPLEVVVAIPGDFDLERNLHECFADLHMHHEWFRPEPRLVEAVARIAKGEPVEQVIDLTAKVGSIRKGKVGGAGWSPATRAYMSLFTRMRHAGKRASTARGLPSHWFPRDIDALIDAIRAGHIPSPAQEARVAAVLAEPAAHFLTHEERYPELYRKRAA